MRLIEETVTKTYKYNKNMLDGCLVEEVVKYHYDSEEEKNSHKIKMESDGWTDSEKVLDNIGTVMNPTYVWYGGYYKYKEV